MTRAQKKSLMVVAIVIAIIVLVVSCKQAEDERRQRYHEQQLQEYGERFTQQYLDGVQIMSELDYDHPDQEKLEQADHDLIMWLPEFRHNDAYDDIYNEAIKATKPPYADYETNALYDTVCALKLLAKYDNDLYKAASLSDFFMFYVKAIPENYSGVCKEKIASFRQKAMDCYENQVLPERERREAQKRNSTPVSAKPHTGPGHYDENGYWETENYDDYTDMYDHDGYMDEVFEDNAGDYKAPQKSSSAVQRHTGGGTRRWRDK